MMNFLFRHRLKLRLFAALLVTSIIVGRAWMCLPVKTLSSHIPYLSNWYVHDLYILAVVSFCLLLCLFTRIMSCSERHGTAKCLGFLLGAVVVELFLNNALSCQFMLPTPSIAACLTRLGGQVEIADSSSLMTYTLQLFYGLAFLILVCILSDFIFSIWKKRKTP